MKPAKEKENSHEVFFYLFILTSILTVFRVAVLDKVTDFLLFLGKLLIVGIVGKCMVVPFSVNNNDVMSSHEYRPYELPSWYQLAAKM